MPLILSVLEAQDGPSGPYGPQGAEPWPQTALAPAASGPGCGHPRPAAPDDSTAERGPQRPKTWQEAALGA